MIEPLPQQGPGDWWQYLAEVEQVADGYGITQAKLWDDRQTRRTDASDSDGLWLAGTFEQRFYTLQIGTRWQFV